ncbi:MlaD family protein [uncultured Williamsia sp.]|uniref:MlaD family protein n=1 Tax=uncultured Williamsia sp. TaxID=259311 RepID=UPI002612DF2B|nr:MlaD family protein [uncultured Williamsia sp.]
MNASFRWISDQRRVLSVVALVVTTVLAGGYLVFGSLRVDPFQSTYTVRVDLAKSGGLLPGRDVSLRGVRVGTVRSVDLVDRTVVAVAEIDSGVRIPASSPARVAALSAAGEQYLDFVPTTSTGPFLRNGSVVGVGRTSSPVSLADTLTNADGTLAQLNPEQLGSIVRELGAGPTAPDKLADIIDGGAFLISTLSSVLPQTSSLIRNTAVVANTVSELGPGLRDTAAGLDRTLTGVQKMQDGFGRLVTITPATFRQLDQIISDNSPTMVSLLGNLVSTVQVMQLREPAIRSLFSPSGRTGSAARAVGSVVHDGAIWAVVNIYPRKICDYVQPRLPVSGASFPEPYLYPTCTPEDSAQIVRGAANAPLPPGVTDAPPDDLNAVTSPTPRGRYSLPLIPGGARQPVPVPGG